MGQEYDSGDGLMLRMTTDPVATADFGRPAVWANNGYGRESARADVAQRDRSVDGR
jgi:hypothetical protein